MAADDLTRALLLEEAASRSGVAEALFVHVSGGVPLVQALVDSGAAPPDTIARVVARSDAPLLRQVAPLDDLVDRLPPGLCARLLAFPVRRDPVTGTVDVAVADPSDPHPASEVSFHLGVAVRVVRAPLGALEEALRRTRIRLREESPVDRFQEAAEHAERERILELEERHRPKRSLVLEPDSAPPPEAAGRIRTPPWGTPVHVTETRIASLPPKSGYGSEIPIPLTRKSLAPVPGGTQRPPPMFDPTRSPLGDGYAIDTTGFTDVVERSRLDMPSSAPLGSFIPGPPPLPGFALNGGGPQLPFPEMNGILAALRNAGSRDEVLELLLTGARMVARKVALFVVKRGGYHGWAGTPELAQRATLSSVFVSLDVPSIFDRAIREDVYLGPIPQDPVHATIARAIGEPTRDVAVVPVRVSGKAAVLVLADELGDTMIGTRRLEELAKSAGEAFARIVRARR